MTGIRTACVSLLLVAVPSALVLIIQPTSVGERDHRFQCASHLRQIGQGVLLYANDNGGRFPDNLGLLIIQADLNPEIFVCPSSNDVVAPGPTTQQAASLSTPGFCSYVYLGTGLTMPVSPKLIIAYERLENHEKAGMNVLYGDGRAEWIQGNEAERVLAELKAGHNPPRPAAVAGN